MLTSVLLSAMLFASPGMTTDVFAEAQAAVSVPAHTRTSSPPLWLRNKARDYARGQCMSHRVQEGAVIDCWKWGASRPRVGSPLAPNVVSIEAWFTLVWHSPGKPDLYRTYEATLFYKKIDGKWWRLGPTTWIYYPWGPLEG